MERKQIKVVAAIIRKDRKVFATQRGYGNYKDWWEFPGGKIEAGETPQAALKREILEELNTEIGVDEFLTTVEYDYPEFHLSMDCFWCHVEEGELTLLEHEAAKWLPLSDLRQVNWLPADVLVIEKIEEHAMNRETLVLKPLAVRLSVCKVADYSGADLTQPFCFIGKTDEENSLVCPVSLVPDNTTERDDGWRAFRIIGQLEFSLIGILARISEILASNGIGIFAISTYNTDYVLTKEETFDKALEVLKNAGYEIKD